jgi:hypothetical protein
LDIDGTGNEVGAERESSILQSHIWALIERRSASVSYFLRRRARLSNTAQIEIARGGMLHLLKHKNVEHCSGSCSLRIAGRWEASQ